MKGKCMFYDDEYNEFRQPERVSHVRVLHASPNAPRVDVYANDRLIARNISYKEFSEYRRVPSGNYRIRVYPAGKTKNPVISTRLTAIPGSILTLAVIGMLPNVNILPVLEPRFPQSLGRSCVRFVHVSPNAPSVNISTSSGTGLFKNVSYKNITNYACITPSNYTFQLRSSKTNNVVLTVPNVRLLSNKFYTVYVVGLVVKTPPLQVLVALDGRTYIKRSDEIPLDYDQV